VIFAVTNGYLDEVPINQIKPWEVAFHRYLDEQAADLMADLREQKVLSDELSGRLVEAIKSFSEGFEA
jgi:F-type H+-transporting ATPase subunit alpha